MNPEYYCIIGDEARGPYETARQAQADVETYEVRMKPVKIVRLVRVSHTETTYTTTWHAPYELDGFYIDADEMDP
jgi:hypothetical protein